MPAGVAKVGIDAERQGHGDPVGLVYARGDTYEDFVHAIVSTSSRGMKKTTREPVSVSPSSSGRHALSLDMALLTLSPAVRSALRLLWPGTARRRLGDAGAGQDNRGNRFPSGNGCVIDES